MSKLFLIVFALGSAVAHAASSPHIEKRKGEVGVVVLGEAAEAALKQYDSKFKIYKATDYIGSVQALYKDVQGEQTPMAVVGDFNGDGTNDIAVMGNNGKTTSYLALVSKSRKFSVVAVDSETFLNPAKSFYPPKVEDAAESDENESSIEREAGLTTYLELVVAKSKAAKDEDPDVMHFKTDALSINEFQAPVRLFQFKSGKFSEYE